MTRTISVVSLLLLGFLRTQANSISCEGVAENEIVLFPNPANCSTFFQCVYGEQIEIACPANLEWNDEVKECDYPENSQCEIEDSTILFNSLRIHNSCVGIPPSVDLVLPNPDDCGSFIQCVHEQPVVRPCPVGLHWSTAANRCEWPAIANCRRNSCEGVAETENVLLPNPQDCGSYIQCVHQQPVVQPCPSGLHWSVQANKCDWPNIAKCSNSIIKQNYKNCSEVPFDEIVLLPNPSNCSTYIECTHQKPVVMPCPDGLQWNNATIQCDFPESAKCREVNVTKTPNRCEGIPSNANIILPNPADCESFIQCVHGKEMIRPCPAGLHWSVAENRCEWPEIANCRRNSCEGVPETENVLLPNPENCGSYIQCVHQQPVVRPCPPGLHWSVQANRCDWPNTANCEQLNP